METIAEEWTKVFYGGPVPVSQALVIQEDVVKTAMIIKSDIRSKAGLIPDAIMETAVMSAFALMRQLGAREPEAYRKSPQIGTKAFQQAMTKVHEGMRQHKQEQEQAASQKDLEARSAIRVPIREKLQHLFDGYRESLVAENDDYPALSAWKCLIANHLDQIDMGGYAFFLINWRFPQEYGFFDHPDTIEICNAHPKLMNRKVSQLSINQKRWRGKH